MKINRESRWHIVEVQFAPSIWSSKMKSYAIPNFPRSWFKEFFLIWISSSVSLEESWVYTDTQNLHQVPVNMVACVPFMLKLHQGGRIHFSPLYCLSMLSQPSFQSPHCLTHIQGIAATTPLYTLPRISSTEVLNLKGVAPCFLWCLLVWSTCRCGHWFLSVSSRCMASKTPCM